MILHVFHITLYGFYMILYGFYLILFDFHMILHGFYIRPRASSPRGSVSRVLECPPVPGDPGFEYS